jgi:hypothetical protein
MTGTWQAGIEGNVRASRRGAELLLFPLSPTQKAELFALHDVRILERRAQLLRGVDAKVGS